METTLFPATLPECVSKCGGLWDVNGACVPPGAPQAEPAVYSQCFCSRSELSPFSTGVSGVCDGACENAADMTSIQAWYAGYCGGATAAPEPTTTGAAGSTGKPLPSEDGGGNWISTHWQWVIMLVILVVGITGIWIGACIWRRRYIAKRDRTAALGKMPAAGASAGGAGDSWTPGASGALDAAVDKEAERRQWQVAERT